MTTPLKRRIRVALDSLAEQLATDLKRFDYSSAGISNEDAVDDLEQLLDEMRPIHTKVCQQRHELRVVLEEWSDLTRKMPTEERMKAVDTELELLMNDQKVEDRLREAERFEGKINAWIAQHNKEVKKLKRRIGTAARQQNNNITLPPTKLPEFHGATETWPEFWAEFEQAIDGNNNLTDAKRHTYLKLQVHGPAKELIAGLPLDGSQYGTAVQLLKDRYGNTERRTAQLFSELLALPTCSSLSDATKFAADLEKIARQLSVLGQDIEGQQTYSQLESKLPKQLMRSIMTARKAEPNWSTTLFRETLQQLLEEETALAHAFKLSRPDSAKEKKPTVPEDKYKPHKSPTVNFGTVQQQSPKKRTDDRKPIGRPVQPPRNINWLTQSSRQQQQTSTGGKAQPNTPCPFCSQQHWAAECHRFASTSARRNRATELKLCLKCLRQGHSTNICQHPRKCYRCKGQHPLALCTQLSITPPRPRQYGIASGANAMLPTVTAPLSVTNAVTETAHMHVLLLTAEAHVSNPALQDNGLQSGLFIDCGSQPTFISEELAEQLRLEPIESQQLSVRGLGPSSKVNDYRTSRVRFDVQTTNGPLTMEAFVVPRSHFPPLRSVPASELDIDSQTLQTLPLAAKCRLLTPDIIVGNQYCHALKIREIRRLPSGFWVNDSVLGKMLDGEGLLANVAAVTHCLNMTILTDHDEDFREQAKRFFQADNSGIDDEPTASEVDEQVLNWFKQQLEFVDGRYVTGLPFKKDAIRQLPNNYALARARLESQLKELRRKPELLRKYDDIIRNQITEGIIERAPRQPEGPLHYLPHFHVVKEESGKVRIVFDAAAKLNRADPCLNDLIHAGPLLLNDLCGILMRFRLHPIGIISDLKAAFLQVGLRADSRDSTRFLWKRNPEDPSSPIEVWRFARVTFGVNCSPFLLAATVQEHLAKFPSEISQKAKDDIYVDNIVTGVDSHAQALAYCRQMREMFAEGNMELREFASNDHKVIAQLPPDARLSGMASGQPVKVLGVVWDTFLDTLHFKMPEPAPMNTDPLAKRTILSLLAQTFDPQGLISPLLLEGKRFLQQLWAKGKDWDDELELADVQKWHTISAKWTSKRAMRIPRRYFDWKLQDCTNFQLHVFSDASLQGLGYAVYLRTSKGDKHVSSLVYARSKIISITKSKKTTVPRLELQALAEANKATSFVRKHLGLEISLVQLWTDASCVVEWLKGHNLIKDVFISNRLRKLVDSRVRHLPGTHNPADIASRGVDNWDELIASSLWFEGPEWLSQEPEKWPTVFGKLQYDPEKDRPPKERQFYSISALTIDKNTPPKTLLPLERFSTTFYAQGQWKSGWHKAKATLALVHRFLRIKVFDRCANPPPSIKKYLIVALPLEGSNLPTAEELALAEDALLKEAQRIFPPAASLKADLVLRTDSKGIIRSAGRLDHTDLQYDAKWPIFVPKGAEIARLLAEQAHAEVNHAGTNTALAMLRLKYWIPSARRVINGVRCNLCIRFKAKPYAMPPPPALPASRVTRNAAWSRIGVDYFGPLRIYEKGQEIQKVWVGLFTCQLTRAIHLEVAMDCSADQFASALRRFIALRRMPEEIISDNGTNFTASAKALRQLWGEVMRHPRIQNLSAMRGIQWRFITEAAPWRGGFYERLIGSVKSAMRKSLGRWRLSRQELATTLYEIAAIINERPLTHLPEKPDTFLRPIDLLRLDVEGVTTLPEYETDDPKDPKYKPRRTGTDQLIDAWDKAIQKHERFWSIWQGEYLLALRERQRRLNAAGAKAFPAVGSVVLVEDENSPRSAWRIARILELTTSRDGQTRTAKIRLGTGRDTHRPINLLYPLEFEDEEFQFQAQPEDPHPTQETVVSATLIMAESQEQQADQLIINVAELQEQEGEMLENAGIWEGGRIPPNYRIPRRLRQPQMPRTPSPQPPPVRRLSRSPPRNRRRFAHPSRPRNRSHSPQHSRPRTAQRRQRTPSPSRPKAEKRRKQLQRELPFIPIPTGWNLEETCRAGKADHRDCTPAHVWDIAQQLGTTAFEPLHKMAKFFQQLLMPMMLQQLLCAWLLSNTMEKDKDGKKKRRIKTNNPDFSKNASEYFYQLSQARSAEQCLRVWESTAQSFVDRFIENEWTSELFWHIFELRRHSCRTAELSITQDPHKAISDRALAIPATLPHAVEAGTAIPRRLVTMLDLHRAAQHYNYPQMATTKFLFIGDSTVKEYAAGIIGAFHHVLRLEQLPSALPNLVYLTAKVEAIFIWTGRDHIVAGGSAAAYRQALQSTLAALRQFIVHTEDHQRRLFIMAPPKCVLNTDKRKLAVWEEAASLTARLNERHSWLDAAVPPCSIDSAFDSHLVDQSGGLTRIGKEAVDGYLNSEYGLGITRRAPKELKPKTQPKSSNPGPPGPSNQGSGGPPKPGPSSSGGRPTPSNRGKPGTNRPSIFGPSTSAYTSFMALVALASVIPATAQPTTVSWCRHRESTLWDLRAKPHCPPPVTPKPPRNVTIDVWEEVIAPMRFSANLCSIRRDNVTYYENLLGDRFSRNVSEFLPVAKAECDLMVQNGRCAHNMADMKREKTTNGVRIYTQNALQVSDIGLWNRLWRNEFNASVVNCYASPATIYASRDTWEVTVPGTIRMGNCWLNTSSCQVSEGLVTWNVRQVNICRFRPTKKNWPGEYDEEQKIWRDIGHDFALSFQEPEFFNNCNTTPLVMADQGMAILAAQFARLAQPAARNRRVIATEERVAAGDTHCRSFRPNPRNEQNYPLDPEP